MVGFFQVVGLVGRSVAQSVEVTPKGFKDRGERSQRLQGQSPQTSQRLERQSLKKSSRPGLSSVAGQVKASGSPVELACLIQRERTSEVFW